MSRLQLKIISIKISIALSVDNQRWVYICMISPVNFSRVQSLFFGIHNTNDVKQITLLLVIQWCILLFELVRSLLLHYSDVKMGKVASEITSPTIVYWTVYSDADQRKHQSSESLAFVWGNHRDRWMPRTKGQLRGKCFYLMTSSW